MWQRSHSSRLIDWSLFCCTKFPIPNCGRVHSFRLNAQFPIPIQLWESSFTFIETHWLVIVVLYDRPRHPASAQTLVQRWKAAAKKKENAMNDRIKAIFAPPMNDRIKTIFCHWDEWPNYRNVLPLHDFMPPQWMTKLKRFLCHRMIFMPPRWMTKLKQFYATIHQLMKRSCRSVCPDLRICWTLWWTRWTLHPRMNDLMPKRSNMDW